MPSDWSSDVCSRSEEHTSELQSHDNLVCRLLLEKNAQVRHGQDRADAGGFGERLRGPRPRGRFRSPARRPPPSRRAMWRLFLGLSFFFNDTATTEIYTLSLHDALPI